MCNSAPPVPERLAAYVEALIATNREINLTAARTVERAREILVVPSLGIRAAWEGDAPHLAVDIGSGNGFPGVAVATLWPASHVVLVERRQKKARAVAACLLAAGVTNAESLACDAREIKNEAPELLGRADLVTLRAVGPLEETTRLAAPLLAPGGRVVHWKKSDIADDERAAGRRAARKFGLRVLPDVEQPDGEGLLIVYQRPESRA